MIDPFTKYQDTFSHNDGHSQNNTGWTVGAGLGGALGVTLKAEYLYVDLGSLNDADDNHLRGPSVGHDLLCDGGRTFTHTHFTDNIFRGELSIPLIAAAPIDACLLLAQSGHRSIERHQQSNDADKHPRNCRKKCTPR